MIGIPKTINTKKDVENLHEMAKQNLIDRKEWAARLNKFAKEDMFYLPVLEKGEGYFVIPKTDRELPAKYATAAIVVVNDEETGKENEVIKIEGEISENYMPLSAGHQEADRLGITQEEIKKMLKELE